jgi:hypothetical protein
VSVVVEFEEVGHFHCSETGGGGVIFVGVVLVGKLSVVDFDLGLGCSQSKSKNFEQVGHALSNPTETRVIKPSFLIVVLGREGRVCSPWCAVGVVVVMGGGDRRHRCCC